jgi:hypothetical protein
MSCGAVSGYPGFSRWVFFKIKQGSGVFERGVKGTNGYSFWKIKLKKTGKVSLKGRYFWDGTKSIIFSGQIGVDPQDPGREILWFKGSRGPRFCEGKLDRKLPLSAMEALSDRIPQLAKTLQERMEESAVNFYAMTLEADQKREDGEVRQTPKKESKKISKEEEARRIDQLEAERKRKEAETIRRAAQEAERKWKEAQARRIAEQEAARKRQEQAAKLLAKKKTQQDTTPPEIVIFSHDTSRAITVVRNQKKVIISGRAADKNGIVEVFVNKMEANLDEKGNFDIGILLGVGKNDIVVSAMDTYENRATKTFSITREALAEPQDQKTKTSSEQYYALVIGNDKYQYIRKLETAKRDARDVAKVLKQVYGFEAKILLDATRNDIVQAINEIRKSLKENDSLLIYYAGHGEFDKTANKAYWLPVDARSDDDTNWILADRITSNIRRISSKHILVVADSCYSGTFTRRAVTDLSSAEARDRYLKKMRAKKSRTLLASGGNEPVSDIGAKGHSVFAAALLHGLKGMEKDVFTAEELFYEHVKERVAGNADQIPEYNIIRNSGHDGGDFVFRRVKK